MDIAQRRKKYGHGKTVTETSTKIDVKFDVQLLDLMCSYVVSNNRNIRRSHLINMRNLFAVINRQLYTADLECLKRIDFIDKCLEAKLIKGYSNSLIVYNYAKECLCLGDTDLSLEEFATLSTAELEYINDTVSETLKYTFVYNDIDRMMDICVRFKSADYKDRGPIVSEFESLIVELMSKFRRAKPQALTEMTFSLKEGDFEEAIREIHDTLSSPSRRLVTGMQGVNELLAGGFENTRVYLLLGATGIGKSLTLLNLAYQMKKYNKYFQPKDPTKIPTIVYLTMENTVTETVSRLFNVSTSPIDMTKYTQDEVIEMLRTDGELFLTDESNINILVKYMPNKSVDTGYLYDLVEDLEDEGYETICLIQDHIKRIRSCFKQTDLRIELGEIVNEFKVFAQLKDIPVITNTHLNRDAARVIDEMKIKNKADLTRQLGRANTGESMLMLDNVDLGIIINVEYDHEGNKWMVFSRVKMRDKATMRDYICQPFVPDNDIKLMEDFYSQVPVFKETLRPNGQDLVQSKMNKNNIPQQTTITINDMEGLTSLDSFEDTNLFSGNMYQQNETVYIDEMDTETLSIEDPTPLPNIFKQVITFAK